MLYAFTEDQLKSLLYQVVANFITENSQFNPTEDAEHVQDCHNAVVGDTIQGLKTELQLIQEGEQVTRTFMPIHSIHDHWTEGHLVKSGDFVLQRAKYYRDLLKVKEIGNGPGTDV